MKSVALTFLLAFLLNFVWENIHSYLYVVYRGQEITEMILMRAALFDALFITAVLSPFILKPEWKRYVWVSIAVALAFAIKLELFALSTDRWSYNSFMPLVPWLGVGLSPSVQLPLLTYATYFFVLRKKNEF
jgi:hypothetical protein